MEKITELLKASKPLLNKDLYIQFDKSVCNTSPASPLYWIDGLQLNKKTNKVTVWLSSFESEIIDPIALERIEDMAAAIKAELERTLAIEYKVLRAKVLKKYPDLKRCRKNTILAYANMMRLRIAGQGVDPRATHASAAVMVYNKAPHIIRPTEYVRKMSQVGFKLTKSNGVDIMQFRKEDTIAIVEFIGAMPTY